MRYFILFFVLFFSFKTSFAEERLVMVESIDSEREMEKLMEKVSESCNSKNFKEFMNCFTKKRASSIRKTMRECFAKHDVEMEILSVKPTGGDEKSKEFILKYSWDADNVQNKSIITSFVVAKKENNEWKIDSEKIKESDHIPKKEQNMQIDFGGAGQVVLNPNDDFLPRDITKRPGGCANGQCGVR